MLNDHLILLRPSPAHQANFESGEFSDMAIIEHQALLMRAGSVVCDAIYSGEMAALLTAVVQTGYQALAAAIASRQAVPETVAGQARTYQMLAIIQRLSEKIHACSSGQISDYLALYHYCSALTTGFLNADFNKAFRNYHQWLMESENEGDGELEQLPNLSDCLYE